MRINSNIGAVRAQLQKLQAVVPQAATRALTPAIWAEDAAIVARNVLEALADTDSERAIIPQMVASIRAGLLEGGMRFTMRVDAATNALSIEEMRAARAAAGRQLNARDFFGAQVLQFEQAIQEWVETPEDELGKRRDARDFGKTDEEIAQFITYIMLTPNPPAGVEEARGRLEPHIRAFLMARHSAVSPEVIGLWLQAVLLAWRDMVQDLFPERFRASLRYLMS